MNEQERDKRIVTIEHEIRTIQQEIRNRYIKLNKLMLDEKSLIGRGRN